jgi:signal transduction histidine kinase
VPVRREHDVIGAVVIERSDGEAFTAEQQDVVERVVARAAVAIENARLYAAVQAADKAKSEFVGIVAHDLKTPMTSIAGYADLTMLQGNLEERQNDFLRRIKDTVKRMEMLVSDLADISRIESGHFFMDETHVKVPHIIQAVKDGTMPQIEGRHHKLVENIEPNLPEMLIDYYRLVQVLTNLVSNAYKYTPDGGTITLSARRVGDRIEFGVADTGIGLTKAGIAKLGTKFWRAEDEYTRSQPGTGLGFAITRSLIEQMGGRLDIESEVGKGSKFTFSVAIAKK